MTPDELEINCLILNNKNINRYTILVVWILFSLLINCIFTITCSFTGKSSLSMIILMCIISVSTIICLYLMNKIKIKILLYKKFVETKDYNFLLHIINDLNINTRRK
jgi:hypothetical protein